MSTTTSAPRSPASRLGLPLALLTLLLGFAASAETIPNRAVEAPDQALQGTLQVADIWDPLAADREYWAPERFDEAHEKRMRRHWTFMQQGVPDAYRGMVNPLGIAPKAVQAGGAVYSNWCADCHGAEGMGDGAFALSLRPSPALLAFMIQVPMAVDEYLLWSISEGGEAFGTAMPAFRDLLSGEEIWAVISYMRAGFPALETLDAGD